MTYIWGSRAGSGTLALSPAQFEPCEVDIRPARINMRSQIPIKPNQIIRLSFNTVRIAYLMNLESKHPTDPLTGISLPEGTVIGSPDPKIYEGTFPDSIWPVGPEDPKPVFAEPGKAHRCTSLKALRLTRVIERPLICNSTRCIM